MASNFYFHLLQTLPEVPRSFEQRGDIKTCGNGDEILCADKETAQQIADILQLRYIHGTIQTGYYDPVEDERDDCVDENTGWYYVIME